MKPFKPGDIVKQEVAGTGRFDFFHVERVHASGALDVIADSTGKACGLSTHRGRVQLATMAELVADRAQRAGA